MRYTLHQGDNREVLKTFPDNSIDSIVTDPPYELGFMGKKWDSSGIAYDQSLWEECLRVLKPGGHLIAFGGTRTYHRMTVAIEDAGFEIRDCIQWIYGSGFPKSHDVSKAIDKQAGAERKVVGKRTDGRYAYDFSEETKWHGQDGFGNGEKGILTAPATPEAQQWHGWGTALKPAHEPIVVARKPLQGTVADNVTTWGVGALNIDGCRVETTDDLSGGTYGGIFGGSRDENGNLPKAIGSGDKGRWPANIILDEEAAQMLDEQSGHGASRFFYVAKSSVKEREAGLEGMAMQNNMRVNAPRENEEAKHATVRANFHPTVKPIELMRYLVRLVTPPNGVVLDPFMGSGSTGCAAMLENMQFVGIELNQEYVDIAEKRIRHWLAEDFMS